MTAPSQHVAGPGGGEAAFSLERGGLPGLRLQATPPRSGGFEGGPPGSPPPRTPEPSPAPSPRALADLAGAGALHSAKRGEGQAPPDTAALETRAPSPPGTWGRGEGPISRIWLD